MDEMELDERKVKILDAIIRNYLETGEPVGSRTISKYTDLNLSSATIRNEMADLEELGYILQPHTSAGRIPSDKGYRFYVDHLMEEKNREGNVRIPSGCAICGFFSKRGSGSSAGGKNAGGEHQLCDDGVGTELPSQQGKVHTAFQCE